MLESVLPILILGIAVFDTALSLPLAGGEVERIGIDVLWRLYFVKVLVKIDKRA